MNFIDRYASTLSGAYTSGGTSISVNSGAGLPSGACDFFLIVEADGGNTEEVFHCSNVSGTTLTVAGAQAGTSASNHGSGAAIIGSIMTAAAFAAMYSGGQPGMVLLEEHTASTSATLDFTASISSAYDEYLIEFISIIPASSTTLLFRVSTDGGVTYDATSGHYNWAEFVVTPSGTANAGGASATAIEIVNSVPNSAPGFCGDLKMYDPAAATDTIFRGNGGTAATSWMYGGQYLVATAINAFRVLMGSGNITSGTVRCYGIVK